MIEGVKHLTKISLAFVVFATVVACSGEAQEKNNTLQQRGKITISQNSPPAKTNETREDTLQKTQDGIDKSIGILNVVATLMGVLVALITIVFMIAIALGFFEYRRWKRIRKQAADDANKAREAADEAKKAAEEARPIVDKLKKDMKEIEVMRGTVGKISIPSGSAVVSEEIRAKLDEYGEKISFLETFGIQLTPVDYYGRGTDLYYKGQYDLALKAFEKAIELKPDFAEAWNNKGILLGKLDRDGEALSAFEKAIDLKPDYAEAWLNRGVSLDSLGRLDEALKSYDRAIEIKPDAAETWSNKGVTLYNLKRQAEAVKSYERAIELKPDLAEAWNNKGISLGKLGQYEEALKAINRAIEIKPDYAGGLFNKACVYSMQGDKKNALENLSKVINLDNKYKELSKKDEDFKNLWEDEDFKKIIS